MYVLTHAHFIVIWVYAPTRASTFCIPRHCHTPKTTVILPRSLAQSTTSKNMGAWCMHTCACMQQGLSDLLIHTRADYVCTLTHVLADYICMCWHICIHTHTRWHAMCADTRACWLHMHADAFTYTHTSWHACVLPSWLLSCRLHAAESCRNRQGMCPHCVQTCASLVCVRA